VRFQKISAPVMIPCESSALRGTRSVTGKLSFPNMSKTAAAGVGLPPYANALGRL
jgi:hypothetical protein